jgi:hypothetical protein
MTIEIDFFVPTCDEFLKGIELYNQKEKRGAIWFDALAILSSNWGNPEKMALGVERLIRGWNRFFSHFDKNILVESIDRNLHLFDHFRDRDIASLTTDDEKDVIRLFRDFLFALKRMKDSAKSPVSVAKALSLFAPGFLPIWDSNIAHVYNCFYLSDTDGTTYARFCNKMKLLGEKIRFCLPEKDDRPLLKRIDEYNYSKFTMHWV